MCSGGIGGNHELVRAQCYVQWGLGGHAVAGWSSPEWTREMAQRYASLLSRLVGAGKIARDVGDQGDATTPDPMLWFRS